MELINTSGQLRGTPPVIQNEKQLEMFRGQFNDFFTMIPWDFSDNPAHSYI
jgi:hypothetical protein